MAHPHNNAIENMNASSLIGIIEESKMTYVRENLRVSLHESQVKLLKQVRKHEKPHHKRIRIKQYEKAEKNEWFNIHLDLYLKSYQKHAKKGLIEVDEEPDNGLAYDCALTDKGSDVLEEIASLESEWEGVVGITGDDVDVIRNIALNSFEISYRHKKKRGYIF